MGKKWAEFSCEVPSVMVDEVSAFLCDLSGSGVTVENLTLDTFSLDTVEVASINTVKAYLPEDADLRAAVSEIELFLRETARRYALQQPPSPAISLVEEEDWANNWKEYFKATRIGERIVIKPSWESYQEEPNDLVLEIDPGMAFGTGTHATTKLCLETLERIFSRHVPFSDGCAATPAILDVGTGSGILSIAAVKLGAARVTAIDIDPEAVTVARENLALNNADRTAEVSDTPLDRISGTYDIVVANIIAEELVRLAPELIAKLKPGGLLILSGILVEKEPLVTEGFAPLGMNLLASTREGDWSCLTFQGQG